MTRASRPLLLLAMLLLSGIALAQPAVDAFDPDANDSVVAMALQPDGRIVVVGAFTSIAGQIRHRIARLNVDGSLDPGFHAADVNGPVRALVLQPDGRIVIAGTFTAVDGLPRNRIARLDHEGVVDPAYAASANDIVSTLALQPDGRLLLGGAFTALNGQMHNHVARLEADGTVDNGFNASIENGSVVKVFVQSDGNIVVGGTFTIVNGDTRYGLVRLGANGGGPDPGFRAETHDSIVTILELPDGSLFVGGGFTEINGAPAIAVAHLFPDGNLDTSFQAHPGGQVVTLFPQADGKLIIGGNLFEVSGVARRGIARLNPDGSLDPTFDAGSNDNVVSIVRQADGKLLLGGLFTSIGGQVRNRLARLSESNGHAASEWDATFRPALIQSSFTALARSNSDAQGFWTLGRTDFESVLVHYNGIGVATAFAHADPLYSRLTATADGGVLALGTGTAACEVRRYDGSGRLRWQRGNECGSADQVVVDGANGTWLFARPAPQQLTRYAANGVVNSPAYGFSDTFSSVAPGAGASEIYVSGTTTAKRALVAHIDSGTHPWRWTDPGGAPSRANELLIRPDARIVAAGGSGTGAGERLLLATLSSGGALEHLERIETLMPKALVEGEYSGSLTAGTDGSTYLIVHAVGDPEGYDRLARVSSAGTLDWTAPLQGLHCACTLAANAGGGVSLLLEQAGDATQVIRRFHSDGTSLPDEALPSGSAYYDLHRLLAEGVYAPLAATVPAVTGSRYVDAIQDEQGNGYLLSTTGANFQANQVVAAGTAGWSDTYYPNVHVASLGAGGGRVCASLAVAVDDIPTFHDYVRCDDEATAVPRGDYPVSVGTGFQVKSDRIRFIAFADGRPELHDLDLGGGQRTVFQSETFDVDEFVSNALGQTLLFGHAAHGEPAVTVLDPDDGPRYAPVVLPSTVAQAFGQPIQFLADGSVLLAGSEDLVLDPKPLRLKLIGPDGVERWSKALEPPYRWIRGAEDGSGIYLVLSDYSFAPAESTLPMLVLKLRRSDGAELWRHEFSDLFAPDPHIWRDPGSALLLVQSARTRDLRFQTLDSGTGALVASAVRSCGGPKCDVARVDVDAQGTLQAAVRLDPEGGQGAVALLRAEHAFDLNTPQARPDQRAIEGAWYNPATSGQGVLMDYIAGANTLFLTWFTYSSYDDDLSPRGLQWYTLQGPVPLGTSTVSLGIYRNSGGTFATGPATQAQLVGHATLRFTSCARALLDYQFDPGVNGTDSGTLSLLQLTPGSAACAPLGVTPQAPPASALAGFEERQSGTWYDPAKGGQGFSFAFRPGADAASSYAFGSWFTYDPAGIIDDAQRQHWFTLQGGLADASNGSVALTIYRTIGGAFDRKPTADTSRVGVATVHVDGCNAMTIDYQFDNTELAAAFAGYSGQLNLKPLGACDP